jgi:threonine dehydrogenase-like Zn-dependent dehydrogenase
MVRFNGRFVEIGNVFPAEMSLPAHAFTSRQVRVFGTAHYNPWVIPQALEFLLRTRDRYALLSLASHRFPLERINEAFETAEWAGRQTPATRVIVTP